MLDRILKPFRNRAKNRAVVESLYGEVMGQARKPVFYAAYGVPDTPDGRFEMVSLHTFLLVSRLRGRGEAAQALAQDLFDHMFRDMDHALREMGVGDMAIGKRIQKMASKFYGRADAYQKAFAEGDAALEDAVERNVYAGVVPTPGGAAAISAYMRRVADALAAQALDAILEGQVSFPEVENT